MYKRQLENAASIAGMFLTTECVIVEQKEDKPEMPMGQIRQSPQLVRLIDSAQLRALRNIDGSGLRMMLFAEMAQIRTD